MRSAYEVLGVEPDATHEEIRRAYRTQARALHPDVWGVEVGIDPLAAGRAFAEVQQAWETLQDPERRLLHDAELAAAGLATAGPGGRDLGGDPEAGPRPAGTRTNHRVPTGPSADDRAGGEGGLGETSGGIDDPGRAVGGWSRPRWSWATALVGIALLLAAAAFLVVGVARVDPKVPAPPPVKAPAGWDVGACVAQGAAGVRPVPCDGPHTGRITSTAPSPIDCPAPGTQVMDASASFAWCIQPD